MSTVGSILFHGFEINQEYIKELMKNFKNEKTRDRYFGADVVQRLWDVIEDDNLDVEIYSHGTSDDTVYYVCTESEFYHCGDSKDIGYNLREPSTIELKNLFKAALKLGIKGDTISWYLASHWD